MTSASSKLQTSLMKRNVSITKYSTGKVRLKVVKGYSEDVNGRRTENTIDKHWSTKHQTRHSNHRRLLRERSKDRQYQGEMIKDRKYNGKIEKNHL